MTPTIITAKNGKARPENPFEEYQTNAVGDNTWKRTQEWSAFESTVQWHNCPGSESGKEYLAELVTEYYIYGIANNYWTTDGSDYKGKGTRQVWRIVTQPQETNVEYENLKAFIMLLPEKESPYQKEEAKTVEGKCVMGCKVFTGGEILHHKDCPFYPDSLSQQNTALMEENKRLRQTINMCIEALKPKQ